MKLHEIADKDGSFQKFWEAVTECITSATTYGWTVDTVSGQADTDFTVTFGCHNEEDQACEATFTKLAKNTIGRMVITCYGKEIMDETMGRIDHTSFDDPQWLADMITECVDNCLDPLDQYVPEDKT